MKKEENPKVNIINMGINPNKLANPKIWLIAVLTIARRNITAKAYIFVAFLLSKTFVIK
ncbi:hypothetical protein [Anaerovirgula multivorans]|uniref:hypothetical protein n=1 Tax=Anaerovirgula multivorans TaxID=312168 RepID=UPI0015959053|nr:hypothetical protein [Anaerovirgula multivorans]